MFYPNTCHAIFQKRNNRFSADVWIDDQLETVHVKNTGRLGELLLPGADVVLQKSDNPARKTLYDLISVYKEGAGWVNIDSQVPNKLVNEWLKNQDYTYIKPEYTYGKSRLDFYMERGEDKFLMEVKGCTLMTEGECLFPDAVSSRAVKHIHELIQAKKEGYQPVIAFVIAIEGGKEVHANTAKDPAFAKAFEEAKMAGVEIWNFSCKIDENSIHIFEKNITK